jgi:hypothetical protein
VEGPEGLGVKHSPGRKSATINKQELMNKYVTFAVALAALALLVGCHSDMYDQPRGKPLVWSRFFTDRREARPLVV